MPLFPCARGTEGKDAAECLRLRILDMLLGKRVALCHISFLPPIHHDISRSLSLSLSLSLSFFLCFFLSLSLFLQLSCLCALHMTCPCVVGLLGPRAMDACRFSEPRP